MELFAAGIGIALEVTEHKKKFEELYMMKPALISLTVLSALTFSSCGKSKDSKNTAPAVVTAQTESAPQLDGAPVSESVTESADNSAAVNTLPAAPTGHSNSAADNDGNTTGEISAEIDAKDSKNKNSSDLASNIKFSATDEVTKTGGKSQALNYTSAGSDGLMAEFKTYAKKVNAEQQKMNQNLAAAIVSAKLQKVEATGEVLVNINVDEFGKLQTYKMKATDAGDKMQLSLASATGGDLEFQGGFLKCLDLDGGCDSAYIKVKLSGAYTRIIFRNSYANNHFDIYTNAALPKNANFELWNSYILNKTSAASVNQKIDYVHMSSFEVVNGKSAMNALVVTADKDAVALNIPLLVSDKGSEVSAPVAKISDISNQYSQKLSQALKDATLVANNGLGQLRLLLNFSADKSDSKIWMTLSKVQKSAMTVADVQKFEASLKAF